MRMIWIEPRTFMDVEGPRTTYAVFKNGIFIKECNDLDEAEVLITTKLQKNSRNI